MNTSYSLFAASIAITCCHLAYAEETPSDRLARVSTFAFGGAGYAGTTSEGESLFFQLMKEPDAAPKFRAIFDRATPEGRCYALVALRTIDPKVYKECVAAFIKLPPPEVEVMSECICFTLPSARVLERIDADKYAVYISKNED